MEMNVFDIQGKNVVQRSVESPKTPAQKAARDAANEFEAIFLAEILKNMSMGLQTDGPFGGGHSEGIYRGLLNEQMANTISRSGGIGLSDAVYREILKTQEAGQQDDVPVPSLSPQK
tara:strand:- start:9724 stop:10074 length:351 start_codon:yes stop_codon:yes gene_type:complete